MGGGNGEGGKKSGAYTQCVLVRLRQMCLGEWGGCSMRDGACKFITIMGVSHEAGQIQIQRPKLAQIQTEGQHARSAHGLLVGVYKAKVHCAQAHTRKHREGGRGQRREEASTHDPHDALLRERERETRDLPGARKEATASTPSVRPSLVMRRMLTLCGLCGCGCGCVVVWVWVCQRVPTI